MHVSRHPLCGEDMPGPLANAPLDEALVRRLELSLRQVGVRGQELADRFLARLLDAMPSLRGRVGDDAPAVKRRVMEVAAFVALNLRRPEQIRGVLRGVGVEIVTAGISVEAFAVAQDAFVGAMSDVLGRFWTTELHDDWRCAVRLTADQLRRAAAAFSAEHPTASGTTPR